MFTKSKKPSASPEPPAEQAALSRRDALKLMAAGGAAGVSSCKDSAEAAPPKSQEKKAMSAVVGAEAFGPQSPLGFPWKTRDPFLFCVHHLDHYPAGTEQMGPDPKLLAGRRMGMDFEVKDGFRMYHGEVVPGFPQHPHRGFETVTVVSQGLLDHADSLGAAARYGGGDTQWMTAGKGIVHAEMFPLLNRDKPNPLELFQIWLNLPAKDKMVDPYFTMLWARDIPYVLEKDAKGAEITLTVVAGRYKDFQAPSPPPNSYASQVGSEVAIWPIKLAPKARWNLPEVAAGVDRTLYFYKGSELRVGGEAMRPQHLMELKGNGAVTLEAGAEAVELLYLAGKPIGEPVVQHGPFVMNTRQEIQRAFHDYQRTRFGGWPWERNDPVHGTEKQRFARHADGRTERPT